MDRERWEEIRRRRARHGPIHGVAFGAIIVAVGLLLLLQNLGIVRAHDFWQYWPVALIIIGVARLSDARSPSAVIFGGLIAGVGVLMLLENLDILYLNFNVIWPFIIIAFGLSLLWRTMEGRTSANPEGLVPPADAALHAYAIFGGHKRRIQSSDFKGGDMLAMFGGVELDLRGSAIASGQAVIEINTIFGGVEITIPENWAVENRVMNLFGGVDDKTFPTHAPVPENAARLVLTGYTIFGGLSLKN